MTVQISKSKIFNRTNILFWGGLIFAITQLVLPIFVSLKAMQIHMISGSA